MLRDAADQTELDDRVAAVLRAKYVYDRGWSFLGSSIARALFLAGCPVCRASADVAERELRFLLHEHVNDVETVVQLIASNGFCRHHLERARALDEAAYGNELKIVLLYDHLIRSLSRRLASSRRLDALRSQQVCPICTTERDAEPAIVEWVIDGLAVPEIRTLYHSGHGFCARHIVQSWTLFPRHAAEIERPLRRALETIDQPASNAPTEPGRETAERLLAIWGGGWNAGRRDSRSPAACPVCADVQASTRRQVAMIADGAPVGILCRSHTHALRTKTIGREHQSTITRAVEANLVSLLESLNRNPTTPLDRLRTLIRREGISPNVSAHPVACPICEETRAVDRWALASTSAPELAERGCLSHIVSRAALTPDAEPTLREVLVGRLEKLEAATARVYQIEIAANTSRGELSQLADGLTGVFVGGE